MELKQEEMKYIIGGGLTSTMINAITKAINTIYELGKQTGSTIRRLIKNKYCSVN